MADTTGLRFIGLAFSTVTAAVALMAMIAIANVDRGAIEQAAAASFG